MTKVDSALGVKRLRSPSPPTQKTSLPEAKALPFAMWGRVQALLAEIQATDQLIFVHKSLIADFFPLCFEEGPSPGHPKEVNILLSLHHTPP